MKSNLVPLVFVVIVVGILVVVVAVDHWYSGKVLD